MIISATVDTAIHPSVANMPSIKINKPTPSSAHAMVFVANAPCSSPCNAWSPSGIAPSAWVAVGTRYGVFLYTTSKTASSTIGSDTPNTVSCIRFKAIPRTSGERNLKKMLTAKLATVTNNTEKAVCRFENSAHTAGPYSGTPVRAPILTTTSTTPPIAGTSNATSTVTTPNPKVESRAIHINDLLEAAGYNRLYTSLVNTADDTFSDAFTESVVAKIIPVIIRPIIPAGNSSLHIIR